MPDALAPETIVIPPAKDGGIPPIVVVKRKRGRPKGSRNKKKKKAPAEFVAGGIVHRFKPGQSGNPAGGNVDGRKTQHYEWRERLKAASRKCLSEEAITDIFLKGIGIALTDGHPEQARMIEYMLDRGLGKSSTKLEVESTGDASVTVNQRIIYAKIAAGLMQPSTEATKHPALPAPAEIIEGDTVEGGGHLLPAEHDEREVLSREQPVGAEAGGKPSEPPATQPPQEPTPPASMEQGEGEVRDVAVGGGAGPEPTPAA